MQNPPAAAERFEALDGWRGICACLVALLHFPGFSPIYSSALVRNSYLFVDFFFVLSGFVIAFTYARRLDTWNGVARFLFLRLGRLYPLHLFVLLCLVAWETLKLLAGNEAFTGEHRASAVITNLLLVQSLGIHDSLTWNGPAWSISTELWAYVIFALVSVTVGVRNALLAAVAIAAPIVLYNVSTSGMDTTYDWGLLRCVFGFALGVACFRFHAARPAALRAPAFSAMTVLEVAIVAAVVLFVCAAGKSAMSFLAPFVFAAAVLIFAIEGGAVSRLFRWRFLKWLGTLSYSIYLTHGLVVLVLPPVIKRVSGLDLWTPMQLASSAGGKVVMAYGRNDLEGTLLYVAVLGLTIALSAFTYRWVETPGREWSREMARKWLSRKPVVPAPGEQAPRSYTPLG